MYVCCYSIYFNRISRLEKNDRKVVLVTDTDSTFIYLDPLYRKIVNKYGEKYNFTYDEITEEQLISLINIGSYLLSKGIDKQYAVLTDTMNIIDRQKYRVNMKNEFLFLFSMLPLTY